MAIAAMMLAQTMMHTTATHTHAEAARRRHSAMDDVSEQYGGVSRGVASTKPKPEPVKVISAEDLAEMRRHDHTSHLGGLGGIANSFELERKIIREVVYAPPFAEITIGRELG